jgi:hypothetical protein
LLEAEACWCGGMGAAKEGRPIIERQRAEIRVGLGVVPKKLASIKSGSDGAAGFLITFVLAPFPALRLS